jgi:hypothetical protein
VGRTLPFREFRQQQVGLTLETWRSDLTACGRELKSTPVGLGNSFVDDALRILDRLTCRIALIGQVKAGKSSLSNALASKPDMLPTDVNPFTTAVTHLHFGRSDVADDVAAEFTFFQANEWEILAGGVRHIRELTERLVPGFDVGQLQKQVDTLRRRSEQRLGPALSSLLGQKHTFSALTSDVLRKYVSSEVAGASTEEEGSYSDIVKAADLYFPERDFGFPTTIIDTPGTNDPFLIREEIARRALESAHVHIVLLTPRQGLSAADLGLVRVLQALRKDRIVVFINRIDELDDIANDLPVIVQHVQNGLRRELPSLELPVVTGSAYWANAALSGSPADVERAWSPNARAYAKHRMQRARSVANHDADDEQPARNLLLSSGVPELLDVLAGLTLESYAGRVLKRISKTFCELAKFGENAARQELALLEADVRSGDDSQKHGEDELRAADAEAKEYERLTSALKEVLTDFQKRSATTISDQCAKISAELRKVVRGLSEAECRTVRAAFTQGRRDVWRCDAAPLQRQLEESLASTCREAEQEVTKLESGIFRELKELLTRYNPGWWESGSREAIEPGSLELPLFALLGIPSITMDLGELVRKRWWRRGRIDENRLAHLDGQIQAEWRTIADKLVQCAGEYLQTFQASLVREASQVYEGVVEAFKQQNRSRFERARALFGGEKKPDRSELQHGQQAKIAEIKARISDLARLAGRLENITRDMRRGDQTSH